jgi:hypothetical protein
MSKITPQKVYDVYVFKLIKRALKKEYPWIKDVFVNQNDLDKYSTLFLNFDYDPNEFAEAYDIKIDPFIREKIDDGSYLDLSFPNLIGDMTYEEWREVRDDIRRLIESVSKNPTIPNELKINRGMDIGSWHLNRNDGGPSLTI